MQVEAATGGQDVVRFCGGLKAILAAAGIPLGRALADSEQPKPTANESSLQVGKTAVTAANMGNSVQLSGQHEHSQQQQSAVGHGSLVSIKEGHAVFEDAQQQLAAALKDQVGMVVTCLLLACVLSRHGCRSCDAVFAALPAVGCLPPCLRVLGFCWTTTA